MKFFLIVMSFISSSALAYDHSEEFKLHPEADIICSNEGALFAIDDDKKTVAFGDRGAKEILSLQILSFSKVADFKYDIAGVLKFKMFTSSREEQINYSIKIKEADGAGVALVSISSKTSEPQVVDPMECARR